MSRYVKVPESFFLEGLLRVFFSRRLDPDPEKNSTLIRNLGLRSIKDAFSPGIQHIWSSWRTVSVASVLARQGTVQ